MRRLTFLLPLLALMLSCTSASAEVFTLAVIPDTQIEISGKTDHLANRFRWLADQKQQLNLKMVLHVGDVIDWDLPDHGHLQQASAAFAILDEAQIPYAIALGNHDTAAVKEGGSAAPGNVRANLRITTAYNSFFPLKRFANLSGTLEPEKADNAFHTFSAGNLDWLVINLELWPRTDTIEWARTIVEQHPNHNIIVLTHSFLNSKGEIEQRNGGYGDNSPQLLFDRAIKPYPNVKFILSGHTGTHAHRTETTAGGNTVYAFLQCYHARGANPTRLLTIDTDKGTIQSQVYCPLTSETKTDGSGFTLTGVTWVPAK